MTQLEIIIIEHAKQQLVELRSALLLPEGSDRDNDIQAAFWMLSSITMLANLRNNGMAQETVRALHGLDAEAGQAVSAAKLVGVIPKNQK